MEWVSLDHAEVTEHASVGVHMLEACRLPPGETEFRVYLTTVAAGGRLGRHAVAAGRWQLFCVTSGSGWVSGEDGEQHPIRQGGGVLWHPGEIHESGSREGMSVVIVISSVPLPYGST